MFSSSRVKDGEGIKAQLAELGPGDRAYKRGKGSKDLILERGRRNLNNKIEELPFC